MIQHALQTRSLPVLKAWARQHCRNAVEHAILHYAPDHFTWDDCNQVVARMLSKFRQMIAHLKTDLLGNLRYMHSLIDQIVADTVRMMRSYRRPRKATIRSQEGTAQHEAKNT